MTTPPWILLTMTAPPVVFAPDGMVQEGTRVGDGEEAAHTRERFVFTVTLTEGLRDMLKVGPGEEVKQFSI